MKIVGLEVWPVTMPLRVPYEIAYETVSSATNVFLRLETDSGTVSYGCAAPDREITGETPESVQKVLTGPAREALVGADPLQRVKILEALQPLLADHRSAMAAVDIALHDFLGKRAGLPLYRVLGGHRDEIVTSITIGIMPLEETVDAAKNYVREGFSSLKLKGGRDMEQDVERVLKVREAVGANIEIRFDANQGYTVLQALEFVTRTKPANLELLEQPTPRGEPGLLGSVATQVPIPIMADESIMNLRDAFRIAADNLADMVNIKIMKVGGIHEALHINSVARAANCEVMVGCLDECGLGIAAGLHFALARSNIAYADLDGHLDLLNDPTRDAVILEQGRLRPTDRPGLGFDPPS
jgi:L-alanine-DL-glutamate epimerase-like enolase superfamily enzyme